MNRTGILWNNKHESSNRADNSWDYRDLRHISRISIVIIGIIFAGMVLASCEKNKDGHMSGHAETTQAGRNRLQHEHSPYLLQHAANPVDWYPWGEEAFTRAQAEDRPIFLSIGYSTCHWCHVMAHESFEDKQVAALLNETFVCIKVDREERPDIDNLYMSAAHVMKQRGGWPLTIIMTPDKKPFFAGTYFPKQSGLGRIGMLELVPRIKELWHTQREQINSSAAEVTSVLQQEATIAAGGELGPAELELAYRQLAQHFDSTYAGFGTGMKFPTPHNLLFLLRYYHRNGDQQALAMVEQTLTRMRRGGIFDHIGFGFHRYATDREWLVPHFEKMLYDQALLALAYTEAFQLTRKEEYARTVREIFAYVLRDMTTPEGGFYSAEDADSEGREGKFYLWTIDDIRAALNPDDAALAIDAFNLTAGGNFSESGQSASGENIPHLKDDWTSIAARHHLSGAEVQDRIARIRQALFDRREMRVHPGKDDKILADWNGLMIATLARATQVLGDPAYATAAAEAVTFISNRMIDDHGNLYHRYRGGHAAIDGNVDDYAFIIWGLLELYEATFAVSYLQQALALNERMLAQFWDNETGGLYFSAERVDDVIVRQKEVYDGAVPSGNSVAMLNLLRLGRMIGRTDLEDKGRQILRAFSRQVGQQPAQHTMIMCALDFMIGPTNEIIIVGHAGSADTETLITAMRGVYNPQKVVLFRADDGSTDGLDQLAEFIGYYEPLGGQATAYVCHNYTCALPTTDPESMLSLLGSKK